MAEQGKTLAASTVNQGGGIDGATTPVSFIIADTPSDSVAYALPATPQYRITVDTEVMLVTAVNVGTKTLTATRAQDHTTIAAHANGAAVQLTLTYESLLQLLRDHFVHQVEVDFGATPVPSAILTVSDSTLLAGQHIIAYQAGDAATSRQADENEMDHIDFNAVVLADGTLTLYARPLEGPVTGKYKVNYSAPF